MGGLNVKTCTASKSGEVLNLYLGRKFNQDPDDAYQLLSNSLLSVT